MSLLGIGTTALTAAQTSLATTSHNISNINTEGYSRQRAELATYTPNFNGTHYQGNGVNVLGVERAYDDFLASQVRVYTSAQSQQDTFLTFSKQVDEMLSSDTLGINNGMQDLFNAVYDVSNDPTSIAARQSLLSQAELLANRFTTIDSQLQEIDAQLDNSMSVAVDNINEISAGIANLNEAITVLTTSSGAVPNDLLDQRDQLVRELSDLVSVDIVQDGLAYNVFIGNGQGLVVGNSKIDVSTITDTSTTPPRLSIGYGPNNMDISNQMTGGKIGGILQVRTDVIDASRADLDELAEGIVTSFNTVQTAGVDLDGTTGTNIFDPAGITGGTINVIMTDPRLIAASSSGATAGVANNENALAMANLQSDKTMSGGTLSFAESYNKIVSTVATRTMQANVGQQTQAGLLNQVQLRFDSVSGVNLDEEAANLIKFQQSYQAASQIISVSNTVFNALLNAV